MTNMFKKKRIAASVLACALAFTSVPVNGVTVEAATNKKAVKKVTVKAGKKNVTKKTYKLKKGSQMTLKVSTTPASAKKSVSFSSSKKTVATVSNKGKVTAKNAGTAKITIKVKGKNNKTTTTWVKVNVQNPPLKEINVTPTTTTIDEKAQTQISVTSGTPGASIASVSYKSSNNTVLTVNDKGVVTGVEAGQAVVTVTAKDKSGNTVVETVTITVKEISEVTMSLDKTELAMATGESQILTAMCSGTAENVVEWESLDSSVVKIEQTDVNSKVKLIAVAPGTTKIKAQYGTDVEICEVTVTDNTVKISQAAAVEYNTLKVSLNKKLTDDEKKDIVFKVVGADGKEKVFSSTNSNIEWFSDDDACSAHLKNQAALEGTYTISVSSDKVAISTTEYTKNVTVKKRVVEKFEFINQYLPTPKGDDGKVIEEGKVVTVRFKALDQYGKQVQNVNASDYVFTCNASFAGFNQVDNVDNIGQDLIKLTIPSTADVGDTITIRVTKKEEKDKVYAEYTYTLADLQVVRIDITGLAEENSVVYQSDKGKKVYLNCTIYDNKDQEVNLDDGNYTDEQIVKNIKITSNNEEVCSAVGILEDESGTKRLVAQINADAYTEEDEPLVIKAENLPPCPADYFEFTVRKTAFPVKMVLDTEAVNVKSLGAEKRDCAFIPVSFENQYGETMPAGSVSMETIIANGWFINAADENATGWTNDALEIIQDNGKDYLKISGEALNITNEKKKAYYTVRFSPSLAEYSKNITELKVNIDAPRKAWSVQIKDFNYNEQNKLSIYDGEMKSFKYEILDQYGEVWNGVTPEIVIKNETGLIESSINGDTISFDASVGDKVNVKDEMLLVGLEGLAQDTYKKCYFDVKENFADLKVTIKDKKAEYVAGETIVLQVEAVDASGNTLTSYNETLGESFNVVQYDAETEEVIGKKAEQGITKLVFENGIATIKDYKASTVMEKAGFKFKIALPGKNKASYQTEADNTVRVVHNTTVDKYILKKDSKNNLKVVAVDVMENTVKTFNKSVMLDVKIDGNSEVGGVAYTFVNGEVTIPSVNLAGKTGTIIVSNTDGSVKSEGQPISNIEE